MFGLSKKEKALRASRAHSYQVLATQTDIFVRTIPTYRFHEFCVCHRCHEPREELYLEEPYQDISPAGEIFLKHRHTFLGSLCARCQEVREGAHPTRVNGPGYSVDEWVKRPRGK
jgi:hypothetical protein